MHMRFKTPTTVHFIYIREHQVLLARRCNTGYRDGWYGVPSGHVEDKEPLALAMCRELEEEIGITLQPTEIIPVHFMYRREEESNIRFDTFWSPVDPLVREPTNMEPDKCDEVAFFELDKLPAKTIPYLTFVFEKISNQEIYSEYGWEQ